ncbi:MAG: hypothetical protein EBT92_13315 [Planctomycetes bacterium]|nr:hypothetical protein [Planctomycetota bacterium]NBY01626.1 hypothetical protein [Planctomycetota bacterium]
MVADRICISFVEEVPEGVKIFREYTHPRKIYAIEVADVCPPHAGFEVVFGETLQVDPAAISIKQDNIAITWKRNQVHVQCPSESRLDVLSALADFGFYEGELHRLESDLEVQEPLAQKDVKFAHRIHHSNREHWPRFGETIERFNRDRLIYARLCPQLGFPSLTLSPKSRQIVSKLLRESNMEDRLEMYSDRLEAMEELYEGANDRVADYRWYRGGHFLEWIIVIILVFEGIAMSVELGLHVYELNRDLKSDVSDLAEEFEANIVQVVNDRVSFVGKSLEPKTLATVKNLRVQEGRLDRKSGEVTQVSALEKGLADEIFQNIPPTGIKAMLLTDSKNEKIAQIQVLRASSKKAK